MTDFCGIITVNLYSRTDTDEKWIKNNYNFGINDCRACNLWQRKFGRVLEPLEDLYEHFSELLDENVNDEDNNIDFQNREDNDLDTNITEVRRTVIKKNNGKSPGPDEIPAEIIKASYEYISPYLILIYSRLCENAENPESWWLGYIVPIFKGCDPKLAKHYRGITLNNVLAKIYSQILFNKFTAWTENYEKNI